MTLPLIVFLLMEILSLLVLRTTKRLRSILLREPNSYLKFVTTDAGEKVVFGKVSEGVSGSFNRDSYSR